MSVSHNPDVPAKRTVRLVTPSVMVAAYTQPMPELAEKLDSINDPSLQILPEFAGRACYQSWDKHNPETASNAGYLANIIKQKHFSVLEHSSISFYIEGVSRSLTHEFVRHRHFSYSQLSQRYVDSSDVAFVLPPDFEGDAIATDAFRQDMADDLAAYHNIADVFAMPSRTRGRGLDVEGLGIVYLEASASGVPVVAGLSGGAPETIEEGVTGTAVDGTDVDAVALAILAILGDRAAAAEMGRAGRRYVVENWQWSQMAARLRQLL
mgnify:CR=1 FL=1